ncbi:MAG: transposase, partial [Deltaproteobacteria bacterium]|nr:transposase [Deltaproteobacteria bacterium]
MYDADIRRRQSLAGPRGRAAVIESKPRATWGSYTHRSAISNPRILGLENERIAFRYRDFADASKQKIMHLDVLEFIRRFLLHVLYRKASCGSVTMDCSLIGLGRKRSRAVVSYSRPPPPPPSP